MAKKDNKQGRIIEIVILVFAIICIALVVVDMSVNLSRVTDTQKYRAEIKLGETHPTPDSRFFSPDFQEVLRRGEKNSAQE